MKVSGCIQDPADIASEEIISTVIQKGAVVSKNFHNLVAMRKIPTPPPRTEHHSPSLQVCHFTY